MIDPHVHCRDGNQYKKETIAHALSVAYRAGICAIFDMPNTDPPITTPELVRERLAIAEKAGSSVFYGLHIGLTSDREQIKRAVQCYRDLFPKVVGLKMYAGHSVGDLAVIPEASQRFVYQTLAAERYNGVLVVHCEKELLLKPDAWDPLRPVSHSAARPPSAEVASVLDQIWFARDAHFTGELHIAHVSVPRVVSLIDDAKKETRLKLSCGVTPHHCVLNTELVERLAPNEGILYKVNPPIRQKEDADKMMDYLKEGKIDCIETDHAPHELWEKQSSKFLSGLPGLHFVPHFLEYLKENGFSHDQLLELTHFNTNKIYCMHLPLLELSPDFNLMSEYETDVYHLVEGVWNSKSKKLEKQRMSV
jgi:dihydroorotase